MRRLVALGSAVLLLACSPRGAVSPGDAGRDRLLRADLPPPQGIDILILTSQNEVPASDFAMGSVAEFLRGLLLRKVVHTAPKDIHLGVVSTTVQETNHCDYPPGFPPSGSLEHRPGEPPIITADDDKATWRQHLRSYHVCGLTQYFEALRLALDGRNPGFPRPDALLLIVLMAPENDCSMKDKSLLSRSELWPPGFTHPYVRCCKTPPEGFLYPVAGYVDALLKAHSQKIFVFVATVPRPATFVSEGAYHYVENLFVCNTFSATAAPRVWEFTKAIEARKDPRLHVTMLDLSVRCRPLFSEALVDEIVRFGDI